MLLDSFREDPEKQSNGAPIYIGDSTFFVKRWGTAESQNFLKDLRRSLFGPHHKNQDNDENLVIAEWLAGYGVSGWEEVFETSKKELKYSIKTARKLFNNPEYYLSLNMELFLAAQRFEHYLYDEAGDEADELKKQ